MKLTAGDIVKDPRVLDRLRSRNPYAWVPAVSWKDDVVDGATPSEVRKDKTRERGDPLPGNPR